MRAGSRRALVVTVRGHGGTDLTRTFLVPRRSQVSVSVRKCARECHGSTNPCQRRCCAEMHLCVHMCRSVSQIRDSVRKPLCEGAWACVHACRGCANSCVRRSVSSHSRVPMRVADGENPGVRRCIADARVPCARSPRCLGSRFERLGKRL